MNVSANHYLPNRAPVVAIVAIALIAASPWKCLGAEVVDAPAVDKPADNAQREDKQEDKPGDNTKPAPDADKKQPVPKPRPARAAPPDLAGNGGIAVPGAVNPRQALEKQVRVRLEPVLKTELSFANRAADLNEQERRTLIVGAKEWFNQFVLDFSKTMDGDEREFWLQGMQRIGGENTRRDPQTSVERAVLEVAAKVLPPEKYASYKLESEKRSSFYEQVIIENVVASLDAKLTLSKQQRHNITSALRDSWDQAHMPALETFSMNDNFVPHVPSKCISPELTESQRRVFTAFNSMSNETIISRQVGEFGEIDDISLDAGEAADADKGHADK